MSIMEFYEKPQNQQVPVKKIGLEFPQEEKFLTVNNDKPNIQRLIEGIGGKFNTLVLAEGYGEVTMPVSRIPVLAHVLPECSVIQPR
jgi:hypothetical protein